MSVAVGMVSNSKSLRLLANRKCSNGGKATFMTVKYEYML